jgi:quercetin dioxygenase-like cupin family protein
VTRVPENLVDRARNDVRQGSVWSTISEDLNVYLVAFDRNKGIDDHTNSEVDILLVGIAGSGQVCVDGQHSLIEPGTAIVIGKGSHRSILATSERFAYLTCHRRRSGLLPGHGRNRPD